MILEKIEGLLSGEWRITLLTGTKPPYTDLVGSEVDVSIKKARKKRSLDANGYYWQLSGKLAEVLKVSKPRLHNTLLRRYGQLEIVEGRAVYIILPDTEEVEKKVDEDEVLHLRPTAQVKEGKGGVMYRTYMLLRGSHGYSTKEMSVLIDGLVSECKEAGIETATPEEIERMKQLYDERTNKKAAVQREGAAGNR